MFPLLASWNGFTGTPMETPCDFCLQGIQAKQITAENILEYNSAVVLASVGAEIKSPSGNGRTNSEYTIRFIIFVSPL
jgi:hypothetical protein